MAKKIILIMLTILISKVVIASDKKLETSCENFSNFYISFKADNKAVISVISNQIYISTRIIEKDNKTREFFLLKTIDLGRGGASLDWDFFSKEKKILTIKKIRRNKYIAIWHGFFHNMKNKYIFKETDLIEGKKASKKGSYYLYYCPGKKF